MRQRPCLRALRGRVPRACRSALLGLAVGCAPGEKAADTAAQPTSEIMDVARWTPIEAADDPWPGAEGCSAAATRIEEDVLELDTGICGHISVEQPILSAVEAGEALALLAWHAALTAPAPAEGWMVLTLDGQPLWELRRPIPSGPFVEAREDLLGVDAAPGALLRLHVENHGANSWRFAWLRRAP